MARLMEQVNHHRQRPIVDELLQLLRSFYLEKVVHLMTDARSRLVYLSLKICLLRLAASIWQKRNSEFIHSLVEDLAAIDWTRCSWADRLLSSLYETSLLQRHFSAHRRPRGRRSSRRQSLATKSTFNKCCCSPLREALRYHNVPMLDAVLRYESVDLRKAFDDLAERWPGYARRRQNSKSRESSTCVLEESWQYVFHVTKVGCDMLVFPGMKTNSRVPEVVLRLLSHGLVPDICYADGQNILASLIDRALASRSDQDLDNLRIMVGGSWNVNKILTEVRISSTYPNSVFAMSIVCYALISGTEIVSYFYSAGIDVRALPGSYRVEMSDWFRGNKTVDTLKSSCRITVRRHLSRCRREPEARSMSLTVERLPLPGLLNRYLLMQELC
ncbi:hypothetical protein LSH36_194g03009 [Paralvinella palmiformis]|uniref:SOCS box domain-containing protein n=1 Tax=Paralvinella palmiformis TaxID=53620 RepID=A0AAD9JQ90_9ANNE|nr:hypothetical protein LSH36_194g03009 [Paralvinella palmiformis]